MNQMNNSELIKACSEALKDPSLKVEGTRAKILEKVNKVYAENWSMLTWQEVGKKYGMFAMSKLPKVGGVLNWIISQTIENKQPSATVEQLYRSVTLASFYLNEIAKDDSDKNNIASNTLLFCKSYREAKSLLTRTQDQIKNIEQALQDLQPIHSSIIADLPDDRYAALGGVMIELQQLNSSN